MGPVVMTLEYSDTLTATFTCTAFGGDGAQLVFHWSPASTFDTSSQMEERNQDNSTTSTITTNPLTLSERGDTYACGVEYDGGSSDSYSEAVVNIGEPLTKCSN